MKRSIKQPYILNNIELFLNNTNINNIKKTLKKLRIENNINNSCYDDRNTYHIMKKWAESENISEYEYIYNDYTIILSYINKMFIEHNSYLYSENIESNVFKMKGSILDKHGNITMKAYNDMTADDYNNINLTYQQSNTYRDNSMYRNNNKIAPWEISLYKRNYDRSNEGFDHSINDSSLDNQIHGYDMSNIIKGNNIKGNNIK